MLELIAPELLYGIGMVLTYGAHKYAAENWRKGIKYKRIYGGLLRHITAWANGEKYDPESGLPHLYHVGACVMFLITYEENYEKYKEFDDRELNHIAPDHYKHLLTQTIGRAKDAANQANSHTSEYIERCTKDD